MVVYYEKVEDKDDFQQSKTKEPEFTPASQPAKEKPEKKTSQSGNRFQMFGQH